jgi:hypothetical protein
MGHGAGHQSTRHTDLGSNHCDGGIISLAIVMDGVYRWVALKTFYPREAVAIAVLLEFVAYLLLRGIAERVARRWNA